MFGVWRGWQSGVEAHHSIELAGPRDPSGFDIHRPTAEAGHALRFIQLGFARAQGFFRLLALGDVAGHGGVGLTFANRAQRILGLLQPAPEFLHIERQFWLAHLLGSRIILMARHEDLQWARYNNRFGRMVS
jgi:hypothetical protein